MTRQRASLLLLTSLAVALSACTPRKYLTASPTSTHGSQVRVVHASPARVTSVRGELLAADSTHLWLQVDTAVRSFPRNEVTRLQVRAHQYGGRRAFLVGAVGGVVTSIGMNVACNSYEDTADCGIFSAIWGGLWVLLTSISAAFMESNSWQTLPLADWERVAGYARYPQGMPP